MFGHRIALAMHRHDVDNLLDEMDLPGFIDWMAFYSLEPWDGLRSDTQAAMLAYIFASAHSRKRVKLDEFLLWSSSKKGQGKNRAKGASQVAALLDHIAAMTSGQKRKK